jgi:hypothetical protein
MVERVPGGRHAVVLDDHHLRDLLMEHLNPPASQSAQQVKGCYPFLSEEEIIMGKKSISHFFTGTYSTDS